MDKLKNFIDTNREAFEDDLLPEGHFERFEQKLAVPRKSRATLYSLCALPRQLASPCCSSSNCRVARLCLFNQGRWSQASMPAR